MVSDTTTSSECTEFERSYALRSSEHRRIPCPADCGWRVTEQLRGTFLVMGERLLLARECFLRSVMFLLSKCKLVKPRGNMDNLFACYSPLLSLHILCAAGL